MPRPKGEPTKVVRLKAAWIEPYEAEAKRTGRPLTDVLAAAVEQASAAPRTELAGHPIVTDARIPYGLVGIIDARQAKAGVKPRLKGGKS